MEFHAMEADRKQSLKAHGYVDLATWVNNDEFKMACSFSGTSELFTDFVECIVLVKTLVQTPVGLWYLDIEGTEDIGMTPDIPPHVVDLLSVAVEHRLLVRLYMGRHTKDGGLRPLLSMLPPNPDLEQLREE